MNAWAWLWLCWGVAFAVIEGVALYHDGTEGYGPRTLSVHLRRWFRTDTHIGRTVWLIVSGVLGAWLVVHIAVAGSI